MHSVLAARKIVPREWLPLLPAPAPLYSTPSIHILMVYPVNLTSGSFLGGRWWKKIPPHIARWWPDLPLLTSHFSSGWIWFDLTLLAWWKMLLTFHTRWKMNLTLLFLPGGRSFDLTLLARRKMLLTLLSRWTMNWPHVAKLKMAWPYDFTLLARWNWNFLTLLGRWSDLNLLAR